MATYKSDIYSGQFPTAASANIGFKLERDVGGKVRYALCSYTTTGSEAANDTVQLVSLPVGSKVTYWDGIIRATASVATVATVRIGDGTTANRWADTINISAGGAFAWTAAAGTEIIAPVALTAATVVTLTFVAITSITAGKVIFVVVPYIEP